MGCPAVYGPTSVVTHRTAIQDSSHSGPLSHPMKLADLLSCWGAFGSTLAMPHVRSLGKGLRELRFHLRDEQRRITFWIAPDRRIVLLTTFRKQRQNERHEVERAHHVLKRVQQEFDG